MPDDYEFLRAQVEQIENDQRDAAWRRIMSDPQLQRARQKLSIHEIRLIIAHVRNEKPAIEPRSGTGESK